jgi:DNA adenine methylase
MEVMNIKTPVSWVGNKTSILPIIYAMFPPKYDRYIEPFGGSGAVLFGKKQPDKFEVYNDYNHNLVNLFRCIRDRPMALCSELNFFNLNSRDHFIECKTSLNNETFDDKFLEDEIRIAREVFTEEQAEELAELMTRRFLDYDLRRAAMFYKLLRYSYSSSGKSYASQPMNITNLFNLIKEAGKRLNDVIIENQDFEVLIRHYDRDNSFFYCDPPYVSTEHFYDCGFNMDSHIRLRDTLMNIKGLFLLSYNDCETVRNLYKDCCFYDFKRVHSMAQRYEAGKEFPEILIANYDLTKRVRESPIQMSLFDNEQEKLDIKKIIMEGVVA